jgi:hypothetical protein
MKKALKRLIDDLDKVFESHEEVGDTAVREAMYDAIHKSFIKPVKGYKLPDEFQMFTPAGNKKVRAALAKFLAHAEVAAAAKELKTPKQRLDAFQDGDVESSEGNWYDEYFGYAEAP